MADKPEGSSISIGKWIVIIAILLFIGIFVFEGTREGGWLNDKTLESIGGYLKSSTFWINWAILAGALFTLGYFTPPFKQSLQNENGKIPYFLVAVITGISLFASIKLGNGLIYKLPWVSWLIPIDAAGNFNWKPLVNVGVLWFFFCYVLPMLPIPYLKEQLTKFFNPKDEKLSAAPYVVFLILSLLLAYQLGAAGIWEKQQFTDVEHFFLGERIGAGLFDTHTGIYKNSEGETRYGIFKTKVAGPDGDVFPLGVLVVVVAGLYILSALKFAKETEALRGWKFFIFFFIAASAANRGVSLQGVIVIAYFAVMLFTKDFIGGTIKDWDQGAMKKYLPWIGGIIVAEYAAEMVNPLTAPPYIPGGIPGKTIILTISIILWNFFSNTFNHIAKAGLNFWICQNCGKACKKYGQKDLEISKNDDEYRKLSADEKKTKDEELKKRIGAPFCQTPNCPANSCQQISGLEALSASAGIKLGAFFNKLIYGWVTRDKDEEKDLDAADAAASGAGGGAGAGEDPAERRARLEARLVEIERQLNNHYNGTRPLTVTERNELEAERLNIRAELATPVGAP